MSILSVKNVIYGAFGLMVIFAIIRVASTVSDFLDRTQALERDKTTLTGNVTALKMALDLSQARQAAAEEEGARLKAVEDAHQQRETQLNSQINKERENSRNEIDRLESALRDAGVTDVAIPADVIRMQRERAKAVNRRASEGYGDANKSSEAGTH